MLRCSTGSVSDLSFYKKAASKVQVAYAPALHHFSFARVIY
jgi:hypothetical protein